MYARQTSSMIKFAVTKPGERMESIERGLEYLKWDQDPAFKHYGLEIQRDMIKTKARLLKNPTVEFAEKKKSLDPGVSGSWRLDGQQFLLPGTTADKPLISWGICVFNNGYVSYLAHYRP